MELYEAAEKYIGLPWLDNGRSPRGVDCIGLIICSLRDIGVPADPKNLIHRRQPIGITHQQLVPFGIRVAHHNMTPSDIIYVGVTRTTMIGILAPPIDDSAQLTVIHCPYEKEVVRVKFNKNFGRIRGIMRVKEECLM